MRAITRSSVELGVGAVKVLRCSSLRSDPADAGPADLDGADAQLRFGNYVMARMYGHVALQMVEVDDRFERRYSAVISPVSHDTPSAIARRACGARSGRRSQSPKSHAPVQTLCCSVFDRKV
jgi:hypothetical protein